MCAASSASSAGNFSAAVLAPLDFSQLAGFEADDCLAAFAAFARTAAAICEGRLELRPASPPSPALRTLCCKALTDPPQTRPAARLFFTQNFRPLHVTPRDRAANSGFVTGYFEPVVAGALMPDAHFTAPVLARPDDLITLAEGETVPGVDPSLRAARQLSPGVYSAYPDRAAIEAGAIATHTRPIVWLRDPLEVFLVQVQGSARISLPDGTMRRLVYAGRNGQPYSSVGRMLIEMGEVPAADMGMVRLKEWIHAHGMAPGDAGRALMARNKSYVFFSLEEDVGADEGPVGGAGVRLTPLRSIAVDRGVWSYGLPFWLSADLPWQGSQSLSFRRLMIAQDTGSAILGPARADLFFGSGDLAGMRAGEIRHPCDFVVLLPLGAEEGP